VRLDFFVKLKDQSSTIILFVGMKHSMHGLLCEVINCVRSAKKRYASHMVNDVSAPSGISWP